MRLPYLLALCCCALSTCLATNARAAEPTQADGMAYFEKHVRPLLVEKCQSCHGPKKQHGGLRVDSRKGMLDGGDNGPALVVGKPEQSPMVQAALRKGALKMPPKE